VAYVIGGRGWQEAANGWAQRLSEYATAVPYPLFPNTFGGTIGTTNRPLSRIAKTSSLIASRLTSLSRFLFAATIGFLAFLRSRSPSISTVFNG